jgi:hypothetical protein
VVVVDEPGKYSEEGEIEGQRSHKDLAYGDSEGGNEILSSITSLSFGDASTNYKLNIVENSQFLRDDGYLPHGVNLSLKTLEFDSREKYVIFPSSMYHSAFGYPKGSKGTVVKPFFYLKKKGAKVTLPGSNDQVKASAGEIIRLYSHVSIDKSSIF